MGPRRSGPSHTSQGLLPWPGVFHRSAPTLRPMRSAGSSPLAISLLVVTCEYADRLCPRAAAANLLADIT